MKIGTKVVVKPDYRDNKAYRNLEGTVTGHSFNFDHNLTDNIVEFSNGTIEPYFDHELDIISYV